MKLGGCKSRLKGISLRKNNNVYHSSEWRKEGVSLTHRSLIPLEKVGSYLRECRWGTMRDYSGDGEDKAPDTNKKEPHTKPECECRGNGVGLFVAL